MATSMAIVSFLLCILPALILGEPCVEPTVESNVYTSNDAVLSTDTVFIIQFHLKCQEGANDLNLYAIFNGVAVPVSKAEGGLFQVSLSGTHKEMPSGSYQIRFYDDDGYTAVRKAQRLGDSAFSVASLFNIDFNHRGVWTGPVVQSEIVAAGLATVVWYFAYSSRSKLQS